MNFEDILVIGLLGVVILLVVRQQSPGGPAQPFPFPPI
jgi:hypothetical protein